jgi:hypothetical protein
MVMVVISVCVRNMNGCYICMCKTGMVMVVISVSIRIMNGCYICMCKTYEWLWLLYLYV